MSARVGLRARVTVLLQVMKSFLKRFQDFKSAIIFGKRVRVVLRARARSCTAAGHEKFSEKFSSATVVLLDQNSHVTCHTICCLILIGGMEKMVKLIEK